MEGVPIVDAEALLRKQGLRVTRPRTAVLGVIAEHPHTDAATITDAVRERLGSVSTQAVYDVVHALTDAGLVRRIEPAGSSARYEIRVGDNHHHMICRSCGVIVDVHCAVGEAPCLAVENTHGFQLDEAEVTHWGTCPECQTVDEHTQPTSPQGASLV